MVKTEPYLGQLGNPSPKCLSGKCLYFDGNDTVTNSSFGFIPTTGTISLWQKTPFAWADASGGDLWLAQIRNSDTTSFIAFQNYTPGDSLQFKYYYSSTYQTNQGITPAFSAASWHHITMTFEANSVKLYVDGVLRSTDTSATMLGSALDYLVAGYQYTGYIDELKVYNYVQSLAQIKSDFKSRGVAKGTSVGLGSKISDLGSLSNGLVGYWKTDEATWSGTASEVIDASGNSNHGTAQGTVGGKAYPTTGKFGNGGFFDGVDDYVSAGNPAILNIGTGDFTISAWFKNTTNYSADRAYFVSKNRANCADYIFGLDLSEKLWFNVRAPSTCLGPSVTSTASYTDGVWHHAVATIKRNESTKLYVDGQQVGSDTSDTITLGSSDITDAANFYLGARNYAATAGLFNGNLDEVRIYNRALSPREARDLYNWAPGPVGYFKLDEGTGTSTYDSSGYNHNSTSMTNTTWADGKFGKSVSFNGSTSSIVVGDNADYENRNFTLTAWVYPSGNSTAHKFILARRPASEDVFYWDVDDSNKLRLVVYDPSYNGASSTTSVPQNQWSHVAVTYTQGGTAYFYINGVKDTTTFAAGSTLNLTSTKNMYFGRQEGGSYPFSGKIDEVKIYNYARTQKQIVEDMNAGHPVGGSPVGSQVGYWKFDEGYGTTTNNSGSGGTSTNGTITGATWISAGKFGKALDFETSDATDKVVATITDSGLATAMTLSQWVNAETFVDAGGVNGNFSNGGIKLFSNSNGTYTAGFRNNPGSYTTCTTTTVTSAGTWYYLSVTYDTGTLKMYINGKLDKTCTGDTALKNNSGFYIGYNADQNYYYDGLIDEVKIYNSALTSDEIQIDYNRGQAMVLGNNGDASSSAGAIYCQPGSSDTCNPPVGEWNFNENGGVTTQDTSGNGNTGTLNGGVAWTATGKVGSGLTFDGGSTTSVTSSLAPSSNFTWETWFYQDPSVVSGEKEMMSRVYERQFTVNSSRKLRFQAGGNGSAIGATTIVTGRWYHAAATYDGTTAKVYLNGQLDGQATLTVNSGTSTLYFGWYDSSGTYNWKGTLDNIRVFNYARTAAQIALDYNQGKPIGWWKMDECQGAAAFDAGGSGNTGTITIGASGTQTAPGTCTTSGTAWYNGVTGKMNSSLNFDGTDDVVTLTSEPSYSQGGTISTWIKTSDTTARIVSLDSTLLGIASSTNMWICGDGSGCSVSVGADNVPDDGSWHHILMSWNNTTLSYYLDGKFITSVADSGAISSSRGSYLGAGDGGSGVTDYFSGQIDDVRIYNYALTATQVKTLFNGGAAVKFAPVTGSP